MYMRASLENFSNLPSKTAISYQQNSEKHVGWGRGYAQSGYTQV